MAEFTYLETPKRGVLESEFSYIDPSDTQKEIIRRLKAAGGGIEAVGGMVTQIPGFLASGYRGLTEGLRSGFDSPEVQEAMKQSSEFLPYYKPSSETGKLGQELIGKGFELAGETGGKVLQSMAGSSGDIERFPEDRDPESESYLAGQIVGELAAMSIPLGPRMGRRTVTPEQKKLMDDRIKTTKEVIPEFTYVDPKAEKVQPLAERTAQVAYEGLVEPRKTEFEKARPE